jgi:glycine betaine catabolism B
MVERGVAAALALLLAAAAGAQVPDGEHAAHHPAGAAPSTPAAPPTPSGMADPMRAMHGAPARELYPALMALPELTAASRAAIAAEAAERLDRGEADLRRGLEAAIAARHTGDGPAMSAAAERLRAATGDLAAGIAAQRALAEATPPRELATAWFKRSMGIAPQAAAGTHGWLGLSWLHLAAMAATTALAAGLGGLYVRRMRRAAALLGRLAAAPAPIAAIEAPTVPPPTVVAASRWSGQLRLAAVFRETPTVQTFRFVDPGGGELPFLHRPGQFVTVEVTLEGKPVKRSYTIASAPSQRRHLELTVRREANGTVSRYLHDTLKVGDLLTMAGPSGSFTFSGSEADSIVLIAGGVGITPMMSVLRYLTDCAWPGEIVLLYACRSSDEYVFAEELRQLQRRHARLQVIASMTRAEGTAWDGPRGRLGKALIVDAVPDIARRRVHLCGPAPMMEAVKQALAELGVPAQQVKTEAFGPAIRPADRQPPVAMAMARARELPGATPTVRFVRSGKAAPLPPDASILEVAEAIDVPIDSACRSGTCGSCKVKLLSGSVTMAVREGLSAEDEAAGFVLACQAKALADVAVDA